MEFGPWTLSYLQFETCDFDFENQFRYVIVSWTSQFGTYDFDFEFQFNYVIVSWSSQLRLCTLNFSKSIDVMIGLRSLDVGYKIQFHCGLLSSHFLMPVVFSMLFVDLTF